MWMLLWSVSGLCIEGCGCERPTVEECGCVDAASGKRSGQVPHFAERTALGEGDDKADEEEDGVEGDGAETEPAKCGCDS